MVEKHILLIHQPFYTVLVLYLGIMAFIGWYAGRKTNSIGDFFVLSGKAGVLVSGIAYFSTQFSMGTFLGTPGTIYGVFVQEWRILYLELCSV